MVNCDITVHIPSVYTARISAKAIPPEGEGLYPAHGKLKCDCEISSVKGIEI